jgi:UDP-2-acetamido-3-amino-2,3-dideoxy-glucuronate N-acetyltransferase
MNVSSKLVSSVNLSVAVIGSGYWGKNHVRNFHELGALTHVCDSDGPTLKSIAKKYPELNYTVSYEDILANPDINGVVIATPAVNHHELALMALEAGKDVLVEKPLALDVVQAQEMIHIADQNSRVLMVGHILLYHPAILKLKEIVDSGRLGKILYIQSTRLGMGKVRSEENILWSFAPHDVSLILYLMNEFPSEISATGSCHLQPHIEDMTVSVLKFPSGVGAHIYVSWMNPFKEQRLVVIGDKNMAVFDDAKPSDKLKIYNTNFEWINRIPQPVKGEPETVTLEPGEPLKMECAHFIECIRNRSKPRTDGAEGLRTLTVLNACYDSMKSQKPVNAVSESGAKMSKEYFAHSTAIIDEPCEIGKDTKIWHFSHIMNNVKIGSKCNIGANVLIGKGVTIGNGCKIQNNVSVYEGVTLEDNVFCGPSMVFTNVHNPRCEIPRMKELRPTLVKKGATIGANATIVCGNTVGSYSFIGAGSVVTKEVQDYALVVGNPGRRVGWVCKCGIKLAKDDSQGIVLQCASCGNRYEITSGKSISPI